jgi:serine/threonine-protein kinase
LLLLGILGGAIGGLLYYRPQPPSPPAANPETNADILRRYIEQYNGGDCFFISPVVVRPPFVQLEAFGTSADAGEKLGSAFKRDNGIEPEVSWRQVTPAQCPAITFLASIKGQAARAPRIELDNFNVRPDDRLTGFLSGFGSRTVELLLISDAGVVQNVTDQLKPGTDAMLFAIPMPLRQKAQGAQPQLLLAIASEGRIPALRAPGLVPADQFFAGVTSDKARAAQVLAATAVLFKLDFR